MVGGEVYFEVDEEDALGDEPVNDARRDEKGQRELPRQLQPVGLSLVGAPWGCDAEALAGRGVVAPLVCCGHGRVDGIVHKVETGEEELRRVSEDGGGEEGGGAAATEAGDHEEGLGVHIAEAEGSEVGDAETGDAVDKKDAANANAAEPSGARISLSLGV